MQPINFCCFSVHKIFSLKIQLYNSYNLSSWDFSWRKFYVQSCLFLYRNFSCFNFWWWLTWHFALNFYSYQSTLKQLFQEFENGTESDSQLASVTMRIMQALQTNLDGKSKQYKDPALTHLFLMNNIHYMVRSVRRFVMLPDICGPLLYFSFWSFVLLAVVIHYKLTFHFQVWSEGFVRRWLGAKTQKDCATACKSVQKNCLGKGFSLLFPIWWCLVCSKAWRELCLCDICRKKFCRI